MLKNDKIITDIIGFVEKKYVKKCIWRVKMRMRKKILSIAAALCIAGCMVCIPDYSEADAASGYVVENLDRGISAISTGSGMMVSWRFLADDSDNSIFKLYRNNALIYTSNGEMQRVIWIRTANPLIHTRLKLLKAQRLYHQIHVQCSQEVIILKSSLMYPRLRLQELHTVLTTVQ